MAQDGWDEGRAAWERLVRRRRQSSGHDALDRLSDVGTVRRLLDQAELDAVRAARGVGRSWAEIATRLGVSRQSAWERWRDLDEESRPVSSRGAATAEFVGVTVPDVVGLSWSAAHHRLLEERLHAVSADPDLQMFPGSDAMDAEVVEQKPSAGDRVAPNSPVTLWLRRGPGSAGVRAPLEPRPDPRARRGAIDEETGESVR